LVGSADTTRTLAVRMLERALELHDSGWTAPGDREGRNDYADLVTAAYSEHADDFQSDAYWRDEDDTVSLASDQWMLASYVAAGSPNWNQVIPPLPLRRQLEYAIECISRDLVSPKNTPTLTPATDAAEFVAAMSPTEAVTRGLVLALTAPTDEKAAAVSELAKTISLGTGMSVETVEACMVAALAEVAFDEAEFAVGCCEAAWEEALASDDPDEVDLEGQLLGCLEELEAAVVARDEAREAVAASV
jgi:hypothetical protein